MNWHSGLPSLHSASDVLVPERFSDISFSFPSKSPSPSLSPTFSSTRISPFDTWHENTYSHRLLNPLKAQTTDVDDGHYSSCEGSSCGSGYDSDMLPISNTQSMLQVPSSLIHKEIPSYKSSRFSPYLGSLSPQPQNVVVLNPSVTATPIPGSPNPHHLDATQFQVLMNEATNRIMALADTKYLPVTQSIDPSTSHGLLNQPHTELSYNHSIPRVYLRRSNSIESLVAEPSSFWSTAEQIGQIDTAQLIYQQQQPLQYIEQQYCQNQQPHLVDYSMPSAVTVMPTEDINQMNQLDLGMMQMNMEAVSNAYDPTTLADNQLPLAACSFQTIKHLYNKRPFSGYSHSSTSSTSFSSPTTSSPSPIMHPISINHSIKTEFPRPATSQPTTFTSATGSVSTTRTLTQTRLRSKVNSSKAKVVHTKLRGSGKAAPANRFVCPLPGCGRTFSRPFNLKSHGMTHETRRPYGCDQCDKSFARIHDRDRHLKGHLVEKAHSCVVCLGRFARQDAVTRHLKLAKERNPCAVILKDHGISFREVAAGRIQRSQLGDESILRKRFQSLEYEAKKIKAAKSLEKGMLSMQLLTLNSRSPLNITLQKHQLQQLQQHSLLTSAPPSPSIPPSFVMERER
ncbi:hypothetical protein FBU30_007782 [Linnemannia zychae]|nr:hypothetical protein FBU30_007782 [Linnemannia zychae]